jgi:glycosyltransferase involved in cell wall biosynthesis
MAILVACYNDGATIGETIASLRREAETELIIVDDGSTDPGTLEALAALEQDGVQVRRQENAGPASAWMAGLGATSAPYVLPFSSDDLLVPGATALLADALDANPGAAVAWGDMHTFGSASAYIPTTPALCPWQVTYVNTQPGIAAFRRDLLLEAGGWQLRRGIEDWDL